jgi:hypothetical protein
MGPLRISKWWSGPGGRERTREAFRSLLVGAGFELSRIVPPMFPYNVAEGVPA